MGGVANNKPGALVGAKASGLDVAGDADTVVLAVPDLTLKGSQAVVVQFLQHAVQGRGIVSTVVHGDYAVDAGGADGKGHLGGLNEVPAAEFEGVQTQVSGDHVHEPLADEAPLVEAGATVGACTDLVGHHAVYGGLEGGDMVGAYQQAGGQGWDHGAVGAHIAAHVAVNVCPEAEQRSVVVGGDFDFAEKLAGVVGRYQVFQPVFNPLHGPAQAHGGEGNEEVLGIEFTPDAESAAYVGFDEVDAVCGETKLVYQDIFDCVGDFGWAPHREVAGLGVIVRHQAAGLQGIAGVAVGTELLFTGVIGVEEDCVDVAEADDGMTGEIGAVLLVEQNAVFQRLTDAGDRWQRFVVDLDGLEGVLGQIAAFGHHDRHRLAHVAHLVAGQMVLEKVFQTGQMEHPYGNGLGQGSYVVEGVYAVDAGEFQGL